MPLGGRDLPDRIFFAGGGNNHGLPDNFFGDQGLVGFNDFFKIILILALLQVVCRITYLAVKCTYVLA